MFEMKSGKGWPEITNNLSASSFNAYKTSRLITINDGWINKLGPLVSKDADSDGQQTSNVFESLFSNIGLSTAVQERRVGKQWLYNANTDECEFREPNKPRTDVDIVNTMTCKYMNAKHPLIEMVLGTVCANGLSRHGSHLAFKPNTLRSNNSFLWERIELRKAPDYEKSLLAVSRRKNAILTAPKGSNYVKLRMTVKVVGYAYYAKGVSYHLATAIVVLYMLTVLSYTVWVLCTGVTANSWDTVTELLALALRSPVQQALNGCGAGVERWATYQKLVTVRALKSGELEDGSKTQQLALVLDGNATRSSSKDDMEHEEEDSHTLVEIDKKYL